MTYVHADVNIVGQLLNNILREARDMAIPSSCIEMRYTVLEKLELHRLRSNEMCSSRLSFEIIFEGGDDRMIAQS